MSDFKGFPRPFFTPVPDAAIDDLMADLTGAEFKVLIYICRRTFGWKKDADAISVRQLAGGITRRDGTRLDRGTGLSTSTVQAAIKGLLARGVIVAQKNESPEKGYETTVYALKMLDEPYGENRHRAMPKIDTTLWRESTQQETTQETDMDQGPVDPTEGMDDLARRRYWAEHAR